MKLLHYHIAVAASLGDPVEYNGTPVKSLAFDGEVRYSTALRDLYIYRALNKIVSDALSAVADRSKTQQNKILQTWFPLSTKLIFDHVNLEEANFVIQVPDLLYLYSLVVKTPHVSPVLTGFRNNIVPSGHILGGVNVPIYTSEEAFRRATSQGITDNGPLGYVSGYNDSNSIGTGTFVCVMSNGTLGKMQKELTDTGKVMIDYDMTYLPQIQNIMDLALDAEVKFEPMYFDAVIRYATLYGQVDSQDSDISSKAYEMLSVKHFQLQPELPNGNYQN